MLNFLDPLIPSYIRFLFALRFQLRLYIPKTSLKCIKSFIFGIYKKYASIEFGKIPENFAFEYF